MYIKNKSGAGLVLILVELQTLFFSTQMFDFSKQLFVLDFQDSSKSRSLSAQQVFNLNKISSCKTLSKAFDISKKDSSHINSEVLIKRSLSFMKY